RETLDFMLAELRTDDGGFASALDADSEGEEGRYYAWTDAELRATLTTAGFSAADVEAVVIGFGVTLAGNWEAGRNVLHRPAGVAFEESLASRARHALRTARGQRVRPGRDDKQLASWNGMALRAVAHAALVLDEPAYADATARLVEFVRRRLLRDGDRLWRTSRGERAHTPAFAEDYLMLADGLLTAHAALADVGTLELARTLVDRAVADFWDVGAEVLAETGSEHETAIARVRSLTDGATPSTNSVAADVLQRLALMTGDADLDRRARSIMRSVAPALDRQPTMFGRMLAAVDRSLTPPLDAVVAAGGPDDEAGRRLRVALAAPYLPDLVLAAVAPGDPTADWAILEGKTAHGGEATAFVCRGYACEAPTGDPATAARQAMALSRPGS
ncbi:MAG: thioredoxin domain-containing protein, partial [Chloroflexota bacterium]